MLDYVNLPDSITSVTNELWKAYHTLDFLVNDLHSMIGEFKNYIGLQQSIQEGSFLFDAEFDSEEGNVKIALKYKQEKVDKEIRLENKKIPSEDDLRNKGITHADEIKEVMRYIKQREDIVNMGGALRFTKNYYIRIYDEKPKDEESPSIRHIYIWHKKPIGIPVDVVEFPRYLQELQKMYPDIVTAEKTKSIIKKYEFFKHIDSIEDVEIVITGKTNPMLLHTYPNAKIFLVKDFSRTSHFMILLDAINQLRIKSGKAPIAVIALVDCFDRLMKATDGNSELYMGINFEHRDKHISAECVINPQEQAREFMQQKYITENSRPLPHSEGHAYSILHTSTGSYVLYDKQEVIAENLSADEIQKILRRLGYTEELTTSLFVKKEIKFSYEKSSYILRLYVNGIYDIEKDGVVLRQKIKSDLVEYELTNEFTQNKKIELSHEAKNLLANILKEISIVSWRYVEPLVVNSESSISFELVMNDAQAFRPGANYGLIRSEYAVNNYITSTDPSAEEYMMFYGPAFASAKDSVAPRLLDIDEEKSFRSHVAQRKVKVSSIINHDVYVIRPVNKDDKKTEKIFPEDMRIETKAEIMKDIKEIYKEVDHNIEHFYDFPDNVKRIEGIEYLLQHPALLDSQLEAIIRSAQQYPEKQTYIVLPKVVSAQQVTETYKRYKKIKSKLHIKDIHIGFSIMVEETELLHSRYQDTKPSDINKEALVNDIRFKELERILRLPYIDRISIGTNDLSAGIEQSYRYKKSPTYPPLFVATLWKIFKTVEATNKVSNKKNKKQNRQQYQPVTVSICGIIATKEKHIQYINALAMKHHNQLKLVVDNASLYRVEEFTREAVNYYDEILEIAEDFALGQDVDLKDQPVIKKIEKIIEEKKASAQALAQNNNNPPTNP